MFIVRFLSYFYLLRFGLFVQNIMFLLFVKSNKLNPYEYDGAYTYIYIL